MKELKMFIVILIGMTIISCKTENVKFSYDPNAKIFGNNVGQAEYDGCQYVYLSGAYTHKGNCKNPIHCYNKN